MPLAATPQRRQPCTRYLPPKRLERPEVARHGVIVEVALDHRSQPVPSLCNPLMPALAQLLPDCLQFAPQTLLDRLPPDFEPATLSGLPTDMRESQKIEGLGFALSSPLPVILRKAPKLDQPRFLRM